MKLPIVILHGWNLSAKQYQALADLLKKNNYQVFIPDFPGFGDSQLPEKPYTTDDYVKFLENYFLIKKIGKCILIGHSFGGRIGIKFSVRNPEITQKFILTGVPGISVSPKVKKTLFNLLAKTGKVIFTLPLLNSFQPLAKKALYKAARESDYLKTNGIMKETFVNIISENLKQYIKKISCLTILIWGKEDKITPLVIAQKMGKLINNSRLLIVPEEGHSFIYEKPEVFINTLSKYL